MEVRVRVQLGMRRPRREQDPRRVVRTTERGGREPQYVTHINNLQVCVSLLLALPRVTGDDFW
jgi:hypothetical protein